MSRFRKIELFDPFYGHSFFSPKPLSLLHEEYLYHDLDSDLGYSLDLFNPKPTPFDLFETVSDLIQVERVPSLCPYKRINHRVGTDLYLQTLADRVSKLESRFEKLVSIPKKREERKYTWTAEIKGDVERKYKLTTEIKDDNKKNYKWTAEIKGKEADHQPVTRKYTYEVQRGDHGVECSGSEKKEKKKKEEKHNVHVVEITGQQHDDHGAVVLRQAFAKRAGVLRTKKGKNKELDPQDAALMIQMSFKAYLVRRSKALRALRELAIAKSKLKEIRSLFNNFTYRRQVARDPEERQRFSEKIIVLLLTVDAIEGADLMVRAAKRSIVDELEAMLDVVDPQPSGKWLSMRRRTFDMPDGTIRKEIADGVAQVVQMLDEGENVAGTFEVCE